MNEVQHVKEQHIVPEFLLKQFSQDQLKIWTFDKKAISQRWNNVKLRSIVSTPTQEHVYDRIKGDPKTSLEYTLRDIENKAAPLIVKLEKSRDLRLLNHEDKRTLSLFITSQLSRTMGGRNQTQYILDQLTEFMEPHGVKVNDLNPEEFWLNTVEKSDDFIEYMLNKTWSLAISNSEFYISDNPVVKNNSTNKSQYRGTLGLDSKGIEIYLPLSSSVVLCLYCKETFPYDNFTLDTPAESIEHLNALQVLYSDRFIYSSDSKFELVYDMIKDKSL